MDRSDGSAYFSSFFTDSPSRRSSTSRYASRLTAVASADDSFNYTFVTVNQSIENVKNVVEESQPSSALFRSFLEAKRKYSKIEQIFDLLQEFEDLCGDHLTVLLTLITKSHAVAEENLLSEKETILRNERNTWRLARVVYEDRLKSDSESLADDTLMVDCTSRKSDKEVINLFYDRDSKLRQMQLVIDWLEQNESDGMNEEETFKLEFYAEGPHYWENTLHYISNHKMLKSQNTFERELCLEMDPDAPVRLRKQLHDLDVEDEERLMKFIFRYIRAGKLSEAKLVAHKMGYHWLVCAMNGWMLHHDPNLETDVIDGESVKPVDGSANRDLWKYVCWENAKNESLSLYEKAIFGSLSGNLKSFLPICQRWSDILWAYCRVSVDVQIERELRQTEIPKQVSARTTGVITEALRTSVNLPHDYWSGYRTFDEIFRELGAHQLINASQIERCHQEIQKCLILNDVDGLMGTVQEFTSTYSRDDSFWQMIRFFAHLVLFLKHIGLLETESLNQSYVDVLKTYIDHLTETREIELVAYYVACLPRQCQTVTFAKLMENVEDQSERKLCLKYAKQFDLDVESVTKFVVETMRKDPSAETFNSGDKLAVDPLSFVNLPSRSTTDDQKMIEALDWLFLNGIQYGELLTQGNNLMRYFELLGKIDAARNTFRKLPIDIVDGVFKNWRRGTGLTDLPPELTSAVREYLCHKAYFQAYESFDEWVKFYHNSKPREPTKPASNRFTDKVAFEHSKKQYDAELEQWKVLLAKQAKLTAEKIYNVLVFPDGGWMTEDVTESNKLVDTSRSQQLSQLRKQVIPQLTFVLHFLLYSSNHIRNSLQIADVIASEHYCLYKEFREDQLRDLLKKLRESVIASLNDSADALGYETN